MALKLVASNQITLLDLNDAIITGTAPSNPTVGTLWIDNSQNPNVLKQWNGSAWVAQTLALSSLDSTAATNLTNNIQAVNDMSNDAKITQSERISIKNQIQEMVGSVPTDTYTLPAIATIDASGVGQLYQIRKAALNAGMTTSDSNYTNLGNSYTTLATYLNGLSPLPWNTTSTAAISIVTATWRANWNNYYAALYQLQQATASFLQGNINGVTVGGKNLILNSRVYYSTTSYLVNAYTLSENFVAGQQYTFVINGTATAGQQFGVWMNGGANLMGFATTTYSSGTTYITFTAMAPTAGNERKLSLYNYPSGTTLATVNWVALYKGNKPMDWLPAPEDPIGGRNYLRNTGDMIDLTNWSLNIGSNLAGNITISNDATYGNVLTANLTTNSATGNNWFVIQNSALTLPNGKFVAGNVYTLSFMIKTAVPMYVTFADATGSNNVPSATNFTGYNIPASGSWQKITYTFAALVTGNIPVFYLSKNDNAATGAIYLSRVQLEDGDSPSGWSPAPEDTSTQLTTLQTNMTDVQSKTTQNAIVNTVMNSTSFQFTLGNKADSSSLANYATSAQLTAAQNSANSYTDQKVAGIDFTPYVTNATFTQNNTDLTGKFTSSGGVNMILNSIGFSGTDFWSITGSVLTTQSPELTQHGVKSGFSLNGGTLDQNITVTPGITYTISVLVKKGSAGTGYLKVYETGQSVVQSFLSGTIYNYQKYSLNITPTTSTVTVELNGDATSGGTIFTALMMNIGNVAFQWTQAPTEIYNGSVNMDINGIRVQQSDASGNPTGYTVMTPTKFAGYTDQNGDGVIDQTTGSADEVFRMDKDTFVMKSATINPIKMVSVTGGGNNGIAFVSSN